MKFHLLLAGALTCLAAPASADECPNIADFAAFLDSNEKGAEIIEIVPVESAAIDNLVIYRAENGNVLMIPEFAGCMFGEPVMIDGPRQKVGA